MQSSGVVNLFERNQSLSPEEEINLDAALWHLAQNGATPESNTIIQYAVTLSRYGKQGRGIWWRWQQKLERSLSVEASDALWDEMGKSPGLSLQPGQDVSWILADAENCGWHPPPPAHDADGDGRRVIVARGDSFPLRPIEWLWDGYLARGKLHILAGSPETGKTTLAISMAAIVTNGSLWPDGQPSERGSVMIWSGEDSYEDTLAPRLKASGADMSRASFIHSATDAAGRIRPFDPSQDIEALSDMIGSQDEKARLLIIDPIVNVVAADSHKNAEVRRSLQKLVDLSETHGIAIIGITHFTKGTASRDPVERVTGSLAFGALARLVHITSRGESGRMMIRAKSNISPSGGGFRYEIKSKNLGGGINTTYAEFGDHERGTPAELVDMIESNNGKRSALDDAGDFLRSELDAGPAAPKDVIASGRDMGFSASTIRRAAKSIGVLLNPGDRRWFLPGRVCTGHEMRRTMGLD